jgi:hypothetical protein
MAGPGCEGVRCGGCGKPLRACECDEYNWIFTFGFGHHHPQTGVSLSGCFIRIRGTREEARAEMLRRFGTAWAYQYADEAEAGVEKWKLREIE